MSARDSIQPVNVEKLLDGTDWRLMEFEEQQRVNDVYERTHRAWIARNEGEARQPFKPPFVKHEEIEQEVLTPARVLVGCGVFLALCVLIAVLALNYFR